MSEKVTEHKQQLIDNEQPHSIPILIHTYSLAIWRVFVLTILAYIVLSVMLAVR